MLKSEFIFILVIGAAIAFASAVITSVAQDIYYHETAEPTLLERAFDVEAASVD